LKTAKFLVCHLPDFSFRYYLTLINVFTVNPADQQKLVDLLIKATEIVKTTTGFIEPGIYKVVETFAPAS
jgi:hypothetical protein